MAAAGRIPGAAPRPLAAVVLVNRPPFFASWAASIRHRPNPDDPEGSSELTYTLTFTGRPRVLARLIEPVALTAFRWETRRRLRALAAYLGRTSGDFGHAANRDTPEDS